MGSISISAGAIKSTTGNENIDIGMQGFVTLPNVHAFETGEMINWNLSWNGMDNSSNNLYHYDYTFYAGYANNGTATHNGSSIGFNSSQGTINFSIPAYELWVNYSYEYTLRIVLWDQSRNLMLDYAEKEFVIFQTSINLSTSKLLVFGDSLSDMGNSKATYNTPESPPYYAGRFSNGPVWNEYVALGMGVGITPGTGSSSDPNRAFGGAEAGDGLNFFVIPNIGKQIEDYTNNYWIAPNETVVVWGGGNNFLNSGETDTQKVVNYIVDHVNDLASNGARNIIVLNMPPLEKVPTYSDESDSDKQAMHNRMIDYNSKLDTAMNSSQNSLSINIHLIDVFQMYETLYWNSSFYGLSNVTHSACHHDSITCESGDYIEPTVDEFMFFDKIHPSGTTHKLLSMYFLEQIGAPDTDGDGIENDFDNCPKTPIGDSVNHFGCRLADLDSDEDGINDLLDQCPNTIINSTIDEFGCASYQKDTDSDGITDNIDICPNTLSNFQVDDDGCAEYQKDTDLDNVTDDNDACPETDENASVNTIGCADNQIDDDWDGIMNNLDQCPNTPYDEIPNEDGCSPSQLDSDLDGVYDDVDLCPGTSNGLEVNQFGCSLSQLDADTDGVSEDIDQCQNTPVNEIPNNVGCSPTQRDSDNDGRNDALDECPFTKGTIRGCPIMSLSIIVSHMPTHNNDNATIIANMSCEDDCMFTTTIDGITQHNQSSQVLEIEILPKIGEYEYIIRISKNSSWSEKTALLKWPAALPAQSSDVENETLEIEIVNNEDSTETSDVKSWEANTMVEYLLGILIIIGIGLTIGSIVRINKSKNPTLDWEDKLQTLATIEVESNLSNTIMNSNQESVTPSIDETLE